MLRAYFSWLLAILLPVMIANAGEIYRWTDREGRIHYGDSVPEAHKKSAKPVNLPSTQVTDADRREAQARLEREKNALQRPAPVTDTTPVAQKPTPVNSEPSPADFPSGRRACQEEWRRYHESVACFAPYVNVGGSVKAEAFKVCKEVKMPALCN